MSTVFIYALKEPDTGEIRYVGKTSNPDKRFHEHIDNNPREKTRKYYWIQSLKSRGLEPVLEILDEVSGEHWRQWEVAYIEFFQEQGWNLTNGTPGGDGFGSGEYHPFFGKRLTDGHRQKISGENHHQFGRSPSESTRQKNSAANSGEKHPFYGKHLTDAHKQKLSVANLGEKSPRFGKHLTDAHRQRISSAHRGHKASEETKIKMSLAQAARHAKRKLDFSIQNCMVSV